MSMTNVNLKDGQRRVAVKYIVGEGKRMIRLRYCPMPPVTAPVPASTALAATQRQEGGE